MKKVILILLATVCVKPAVCQVMWQFNKDTVFTWNYEWGDEFNGNKLDKEKWATGEGGEHLIMSNKEQQYYTDNENNIQVKNGTLRIIAKKETLEAKVNDSMEDKDSIIVNKKYTGPNKRTFNYTSGKIDAKRLFNKGFFEIRFKTPPEKGMWPAFWLYGGYPDEEIDIFELKGERKDQIHVDTHCPNECDYVKTWYGKRVSWGGWQNVNGKLSDGFNVIAGEWNGKYVKMYLNGKSIAYSQVSFNIPKGLQANMALPANDGPFHPGPAADFKESTPFEIDYIRVWKLDSSADKSRLRKPADAVRTSVANFEEGKAAAKKSNKLLYGKKANHLNEGIFVSLFPAQDKNYVLYLSGVNPGEEVKVVVKGESDRKMFETTCKAFENKIDLSALPNGKYVFSVSYGGKTAETFIQN